ADSSKKRFFAVDGRICPATLLTPPEAGLPGRKTRELVLAYFGTANWNSILSRFITPVVRQLPDEGGHRSGDKIGSFFCGPREAQAAGSLISTYRVVNTTLRAESEKTVAAVYDRRSGEFQLSSLSVELE